MNFMTESDLTRFLSIVDVADILDVDVTDVMSLLETGELASFRVGSWRRSSHTAIKPSSNSFDCDRLNFPT